MTTTTIGFASQEEWGTVYEVMTLTRGDLQHHLSVAEVDSLTDTDMHSIASHLAELLLELGVWDDLACIARRILTEKEQQA